MGFGFSAGAVYVNYNRMELAGAYGIYAWEGGVCHDGIMKLFVKTNHSFSGDDKKALCKRIQKG